MEQYLISKKIVNAIKHQYNHIKKSPLMPKAIYEMTYIGEDGNTHSIKDWEICIKERLEIIIKYIDEIERQNEHNPN